MNTPRTSIRLIGPDDAGALAAHFARDAEAFARWDPEWPPDYYTAAGQRARIERMLKRHDSGEAWPGVVLADDVVIGQVTIQNIVRRAWRKAELGYWIGDPHQGRGHATRAIGLAVQMMITELDLHRAEAITQMDNLGSQHVLRKNGFVPYGIARSRIFTAGMWRDEILWERLLDPGVTQLRSYAARPGLRFRAQPIRHVLPPASPPDHPRECGIRVGAPAALLTPFAWHRPSISP